MDRSDIEDSAADRRTAKRNGGIQVDNAKAGGSVEDTYAQVRDPSWTRLGHQ